MDILLAYSHGVLAGGIACIAVAVITLCRSILTKADPTRGHARTYIDYDAN